MAEIDPLQAEAESNAQAMSIQTAPDKDPGLAGARSALESIPTPDSGPSILGMLKDTGNSILNLMEAGKGERPVTVQDTLAVPGPGALASRFYPVGALGIFGSRLAPESGVYKRVTEGVRALQREQGGGLVSLEASNPTDILKHTGLSKDINNNWVYEVDDSKAALAPEFNNLHLDWPDLLAGYATPSGPGAGNFAGDFVSGNIKLQTVLRHNELFDAFPYLKNVTVAPMDAESGTHFVGYFDPETRTIALDMSRPLPDVFSTLMHETQHAVNSTEQMFRINRSSGENADPKFIGESLSQFARIYRRVSDKGLITPEQSQKISNIFDDLINQDVVETYRRNPGEVEARNVQTRLDFNKNERLNLHPVFTEDRPRSDQIDLRRFRDLYTRGQQLGMFPKDKP